MKPIAVYVHIPFCTVKCGYCDFNAYAGMEATWPAYAEALLADVRSWGPYLDRCEITSVAFGGGTPADFPANAIDGVLHALALQAPIAPAAEIGIEANPGTTSLRHLRDLRAAGVNRISIGAQSFHASELQFLDRIHSPEAITASVALARQAGFEELNLDLIYGLPGQPLHAWEWSLQRALDLRPESISTYALTIEEGTLLGRRVREGQVTPCDPDDAAAMYEAATDHLEAAGYALYELSNWARSGHGSRHNRVYWTGGNYLGIGAGAHGFVAGTRYENHANPRAYIRRLGPSFAPGALPGVENAYTPSPATAMSDWLMLALRLAEGFAPSAFAERFGVALDEAAGEPLRAATAAGVLAWESDNVRLTRRGRLLHGEVAARLLAHLRHQQPAGGASSP